ncbi:hypothetical protein [Pseudonocardia sp. D17]|uniref:hypothetical protein n=1 Tax=Pseudonocardia sp. D17 TaxID=882661 RepID=UPI002B3FB67D|nr:hypothetical protein PSD17_39430 [Pseudonocardia sp. D17]
MTVDVEDDALFAGLDLIGRTGARQVEIGYLNEGVPVHLADWYCSAHYRGARIIVEHHRGPVEAVEAMVRRLLTGGRCTHCGGLTALSDDGATAYPGAHMADGTTWTLDEITAAGQCRYTRVSRKWVRGCEGRTPRERPGARGRRPKAKPKRRR